MTFLRYWVGFTDSRLPALAGVTLAGMCKGGSNVLCPFLLSYLRVVLENLAYGSYPVCCSLQCDDVSKHLLGSLCI